MILSKSSLKRSNFTRQKTQKRLLEGFSEQVPRSLKTKPIFSENKYSSLEKHIEFTVESSIPTLHENSDRYKNNQDLESRFTITPMRSPERESSQEITTKMMSFYKMQTKWGSNSDLNHEKMNKNTKSKNCLKSLKTNMEFAEQIESKGKSSDFKDRKNRKLYMNILPSDRNHFAENSTFSFASIRGNPNLKEFSKQKPEFFASLNQSETSNKYLKNYFSQQKEKRNEETTKRPSDNTENKIKKQNTVFHKTRNFFKIKKRKKKKMSRGSSLGG